MPVGHSLLFYVQFHKGQWFRDFGTNFRLGEKVLTKFLTVVTFYYLFLYCGHTFLPFLGDGD